MINQIITKNLNETLQTTACISCLEDFDRLIEEIQSLQFCVVHFKEQGIEFSSICHFQSLLVVLRCLVCRPLPLHLEAGHRALCRLATALRRSRRPRGEAASPRPGGSSPSAIKLLPVRLHNDAARRALKMRHLQAGYTTTVTSYLTTILNRQ